MDEVKKRESSNPFLEFFQFFELVHDDQMIHMGDLFRSLDDR
jgi:hypothetical protein